MKKTLVLITLAALFAAAVQAAETKIAVIDLRKVFDGYYKTRQADANLKDDAAELEKERKDMLEGFKKEEEAWRKLLDKANDQAVSVEERDKSKQEAEKKLLALKEMEQTIGTFERTARTKLGEQQRRKRDVILEEIRNLINAKAKAGGFSLVVDTAAESINNTPVVLYSTGENDLTEKVLTELNSTAPAGVIKALEEREKNQSKDKKSQ